MSHHQRRKESREKFLWGLLLEKTQWALTPQGYRDSDSAYTLCTDIVKKLEQNLGWEHQCYQHGKVQWWWLEKSVAKGTFRGSEKPLSKQRYHHLVRLGADVRRAGLSDYSKTTVLGALLYEKIKMTK